jgi:hypothetical protein
MDKFAEASLTNPDSVDELEMDKMKYDKLEVKEVEGISIPNLVNGEKVLTSIQIYYLSGASMAGVNGRYMEWGSSAGALRFRNVRGWVIFRVELTEIPEMGIRADNCYGALDGEPVLEIMQRKTGRNMLHAYIIYMIIQLKNIVF